MLTTSIFISAVIAGIVAILVTLAIERWGGLTGGLLGTMPSTIVPAAAGMYLAGGELLLIQSLIIVPYGMLINSLFLGVWIVLPPYLENSKRPLFMTTVGSLGVWGLTGLSVLFGVQFAVEYGIASVWIALFGLFVLVGLAVWMNWNNRAAPKGKQSVALPILVLRGSAAAIAIGIAVWLSSTGQAFVAGLAAVFPAIFLTSMVALWLAQGSTVPRGAAGPMALGGASVAIYALVAMYSLPEFGVYVGSLIAWTTSVLGWSLPVYLVLKSRVIPD
jgi:hypothetical protein|tara:strand:- start:1401 stop:2225 length:825 start_codon:yes stop_codon:yes gene_type:complete